MQLIIAIELPAGAGGDDAHGPQHTPRRREAQHAVMIEAVQNHTPLSFGLPSSLLGREHAP